MAPAGQFPTATMFGIRDSIPGENDSRTKSKTGDPEGRPLLFTLLCRVLLAAVGASCRRLHHNRRHAQTNGGRGRKRKKQGPHGLTPACCFLLSVAFSA